ncbi:hypothetical protein FQN57_005896 [Myotisia sp. PD_48]|nr:hypothetical protein FQN57_005896 [Myotisia sp. PD_48]
MNHTDDDDDNDVPCQRCERLGLDCRYSEHLPLGRPRGSKRSSPTSDKAKQRHGPTGSNASSNPDGWETSADIYGMQTVGSHAESYTYSPHHMSSEFDTMFSSSQSGYMPQPSATSSHLQVPGQYGQTQSYGSINSPSSYTQQLYHLHSRVRDLAPSPQSSRSPYPERYSASSHEPSLDYILGVTDNLTQLMDRLHADAPMDTSLYDLSPSYGSPAGYSPTPSSRSGSNVDPAIVHLIVDSYKHVLRMYEPVITRLYFYSRNPAQPIPAFDLGQLTLTDSAELNVGLIINLVSQAMERLQHSFLSISFMAQSSGSQIMALESDVRAKEHNLLNLLNAVKASQAA